MDNKMLSEALISMLGAGNVRTGELMKTHTTFRIGGAADYYVTPQAEKQIADVIAFLKKSDIVSIHAPLNDKTNNLFDSAAFDKMKTSAILLNLGRGPIVNDADLADALDAGKIAGAGLDGLGKEPIEADNPLLRIKDSTKLVITPHVAWGTVEARTRLMDEVYENIVAFTKGEKRNAVE